MTRGQLRALRTIGLVLALLGGLGALLGVGGVVATNLHFAHIQCPDDASCVDRMMGRGIYGSFAAASVFMAALGGLLAWRAAAAARRKTSWRR